jgi:hypothetical protein
MEDKKTIMETVKEIYHVIVAILGWLIFGTIWWWVFASKMTFKNQLRDFLVLVAFSLFVTVINYAWVRYNINIYNKKGARKKIPDAKYDYSKDPAGRMVVTDFSELRSKRYIVVSISKQNNVEVKTYRAESEELTPEEEAACKI